MWFSKLWAAAVIPALVAACVGLATPAHAVPATPPALLPDQQDGIFITDGTRSYSWQRTCEGTDACEAFSSLLVSLTSRPIAPTGFTSGIIYLTFPGETGLSDIPGAPSDASDGLALFKVPLTNCIGALFISDGASDVAKALFSGTTLVLPVLGSLQENGQWQDVTHFFVSGSTGLFYLQSDVEAPEPASLALLGSALIGFAVIRRRKRA